MAGDGRTAVDARLKVALLASSFESWRRLEHPQPIYVPPLLEQVIPRPEHQAIRAAAQAPVHEPHGHVRRCIAGRNRSKSGVSRPASSFPPSAQAEKEAAIAHWERVRPAGSATPSYQFIGTTTSQFNPDTFVTEVVASALFQGLSREVVDGIRQLSRPPNWVTGAHQFYKDSAPGRWDAAKGSFDPDPGAASSKGPYALREYVEWDWSPEVNGGIINILEIDESAGAARSGTGSLVEAMLLHLQGPEIEGDAALEEVVKSTKPDTLGTDVTYYTYRLLRCIQSKFLANWEVGGLDVDDGGYLTVWQPPSGNEPGRFWLHVIKRIRYCEQADAGAELSVLLNLLAPAVVGMLVRDLTYDGIRQGLDDPQKLTELAVALPPRA